MARPVVVVDEGGGDALVVSELVFRALGPVDVVDLVGPVVVPAKDETL